MSQFDRKMFKKVKIFSNRTENKTATSLPDLATTFFHLQKMYLTKVVGKC